MRKIAGFILIILWAALFAFLIFQFYRMTVINKLNNRIIKLYEVKSSIPKEFAATVDSLGKEVTKLIDLRDAYRDNNPVHPAFTRPHILQLYLLLVTVFTFFWLFYNRRKQE